MKNQMEDFVNMEGELQKLSSSIFLGYQTKFWKILEDGTKIGYRNVKQNEFNPQNVFYIKDTTVEEGSQSGVFQLMTPKRKFILKSNSDNGKKKWMRAITQLRKFNKKPRATIKKTQNSTHTYTQTTIASKSDAKKQKSPSKLIVPKKLKQRRNSMDIEEVKNNIGANKLIIDLLLQKMPSESVKYNTLLIQLKTKVSGFIKNTLVEDTFIMVSPKSLYPDKRIIERNISNKDLPPWIYINIFYKVTLSGEKPTLKQIFSVSSIHEIADGKQQGCSARVDTGEVIFDFFCQTVEERQRFKKTLEIGKINSQQVIVKGVMSKINYDNLINMRQTQNQGFAREAQKLLEQFRPKSKTHKYEPQILVTFLNDIVPFLKQFITILEHKKLNKNHVILDVLQIFHEQAKIQIKLTWDSSFSNIKGIDILNILKCLSSYYETIKQFITSVQFLQGMKALSKIYVRTAWKNFESIIISIVEQEKKDNVVQQDDNTVTTNGIIDLFKFIYDVYELAAPHWKNKLHLHNVHKLMLRALSVFINEIRSMIDEQVIVQKQMSGIANNYFPFDKMIQQFYREKFFSLQEQTKQQYDKCSKNYRQVSIIILDKLTTMVMLELKMYFNKNKVTFNSLKIQTVVNIIVQKTEKLEQYLHDAFKTKLYSNISIQLKTMLIQMLIKQVQSSKKKKVLIKNFEQMSRLLVQEFKHLNSKSHYKLQKALNQVRKLITTESHSQVQAIIQSNTQQIRQSYLKLLYIRQDYKHNSALFKRVNQVQNPSQLLDKRKSKIRKVSADIRNKDASLSKKYFNEEIQMEKTNSDRSFKMKKDSEKLISQGYMLKGKINKKIYQTQYFRLRSGFIYIFQYASSERCRNVLDLKNCQQLVVHQEKPSFILKYMNLGKLKQLKMKCDDIQTRDRWVASIQAQRKRILNEEKVKRKAVLIKQSSGRKKGQLIIDYDELDNGKDYFSYNQ